MIFGAQGVEDAITYLFEYDTQDRSLKIASGTVTVLAIVVLATALLATLLAGLNRQIIRFLEGYGRLNPLQFLRPIELRRFQRLRQELDALDRERAEWKKSGSEGNRDRARLDRRLIEVHRLAAERFPHDAALVQPTALGNTLRAFEAYPYVIYGFDPINGWNRLIAFIPKDYREQIDAARSQLDFWVNVFALGLISALFGLAMALDTRSAVLLVEFLPPGRIPRGPLGDDPAALTGQLLLLAAVSALAALFALRWARLAAVEWGDLFKAAFDVYLPRLAEGLGYALPTDRDEQRRFWRRLSRVFLYRDVEAYRALGAFVAGSDDRGPDLLGGPRGSGAPGHGGNVEALAARGERPEGISEQAAQGAQTGGEDQRRVGRAQGQ